MPALPASAARGITRVMSDHAATGAEVTPADVTRGEVPDMTVVCAVCEQPGTLESANESGFLIRHDGRFFPCRAPR